MRLSIIFVLIVTFYQSRRFAEARCKLTNARGIILKSSLLSLEKFQPTPPQSELPLKVSGVMRSKTTRDILKLSFYYSLLYIFTVVYNVANKRVLNEVPLPATVAAIQTFLGIPLFLPLWLIRPLKNMSHLSTYSLVQVSLAHALGNLATVYSLESGSVSFTHVIKAAEPIFSAILSAVLMSSCFSSEVYAALLPIVFGVGLASAKEVTYTNFGFATGMISNFFYQLRIVLSKQLIEVKAKTHEEDGATQVPPVSSANLFRLMTIYSFVMLLPIALLIEGGGMRAAFEAAIVRGINVREFVVNLLVSGFSYYLYNEISFWILDLVHPVTHAVGNTVKRVVLIVASVLIFRIPVTFQGGVGSAVAVFGSFLYAIAVQRHSIKRKETVDDATRQQQRTAISV